MEETIQIICRTSYLPKGIEQNITFMELLLDERWAEGDIECPEEIFSKVNGINYKLTAKQNYEFLLRAVKKYPLKAVGSSLQPNGFSEAAVPTTLNISPVPPKNGIPQVQGIEGGYLTDCYIAGKYQQELLESGYFNAFITALLKNAQQFHNCKEAIAWLEQMISHAPAYYEIDNNTCPILIYRGDNTCYNTLNLFAEELAKALRAFHQQVEIFDIGLEGNQALTRLINRRFKAIIGIQTHAFSIMMQDNHTNLHDLIYGPKYNMILDHPAWMKEHIEHGPKDYYLLIHDRNYLAFAEKYFKNVKGCIYFPPAGVLPTDTPKTDQRTLPAILGKASFPCSSANILDIQEKQYDLTFIGSYRNYRERLDIIHSYNRPLRFLTARYLRIMRRNPDIPAEKAFLAAAEYYHMHMTDGEFLDLFYETRQACFCIMLYYREKIIRTFLNAGIDIHVYGDSWNAFPWADNPCLHCHPSLNAEEGWKVMRQSKISLNIMSWHKDGLTERILNAMLCQSVVLSDRSAVLEEEFISGKELLLFSLKEIGGLPAMVKSLLADENKLEEISANGYSKALERHQWEHRALMFL